jgi:hypothetical protein
LTPDQRAILEDKADVWERSSRTGNMEMRDYERRCAEAMRAALRELDAVQPGSAGGGELREGWLPIVLCPTDGVWRACKLPDGREVIAAFDGQLLGASQWQIKEFAYHNPRRPTGEMRGGVEQFSAAYDTWAVTDLDGIIPMHFRPNDTVYGDALATPQPPREVK